MTRPTVRAFFDEPTNTISYLVTDPIPKPPPSSIPSSITTTLQVKRRLNLRMRYLP
jgi:hypothetical protein